MVTVTRELLHRLPKTDLHVHLDGSVRPETLLELAREYDVPMPRPDADALREYMHVKDAQNLEEYLRRFEVTLSVMQTEEALERIAYELAEDAARESVRYMEVRYSPVLHTRQGLALPRIVEAPLRGLRRAAQDHGIETGLIISAMRNLSPETSRELAELAVAFKDRGVVAFDLAGAEADFPAKAHREAFYTAVTHTLPVTVHAGEAYGPASIHQALHDCHANRIGHGTRLFEDPDLMQYVNDFRIPLEVCPTSNVQTRAVERFADHPLRMYYDDGLVVTLNTDNRLMSATTVTDEFWRTHRDLDFSWEELCDVAVMGFESAFLPYQQKTALVEEVKEEIAALTTEADPSSPAAAS